MSGSIPSSLTRSLQSPTQAAQIYSQSQTFPKQRHTFVVRFVREGTPSGVGANAARALTYAMKSFDRPAFEPRLEELSQYNKKRIVHTGYKMAPVKATFYDSSDGAALLMWSDYAKYYFGDFSQGQNFNGQTNATQAYAYDQTNAGPMNDSGNGFGFTAHNGGGTSGDSAYYFSSIQLLHFYMTAAGKVFDSYTLLNPRIVSFTPDDLDFEQGGVSVINAQFSYEALLFDPANPAAGCPEFAAGTSGHSFYDNPLNVVGASNITPTPQAGFSANQVLNQVANQSSLFSSGLFGFGTSSGPVAAPTSLLGSAAAGNGGAVSAFGNFFNTASRSASSVVTGLGASITNVFNSANTALTNYVVNGVSGAATVVPPVPAAPVSTASLQAGQAALQAAAATTTPQAQPGINTVTAGSVDPALGGLC